MKQPVIIVDGYSSGRLLAHELAKRGHGCIHVQSWSEIPLGLRSSFSPGHYTENLVYDATKHSDVVALLASRQALAVIAGCETGVLVADRLANELGVTANLPERGMARRNKADMHRVVQAAGLRVPEQTTARDLDTLTRWWRRYGAGRIVLKPTESAGGDGVFICASEAEVEKAFYSIIGRANKLLGVNEEVLAQAFVQGTEYVVNTVSCDGQHHVVLVWRYRKSLLSGGESIYDTDTMVDSLDPNYAALVRYTLKVLDALGIRNGPAHSEIMIDPDGPVLIEVGSRMDGVVSPALDARCVGYSQLDLTLDAYLDPGAVARKTRRGYHLLQHGAIVHLVADCDGVVSGIPGEPMARALPSFVDMHIKTAVGGVLSRTRDLFTSPGQVILAHQDFDAVVADRQAIRDLELHGGFFELTTSP